jgi:hypothetical protein
MHQWPLRRAASQHLKVVMKGSNGPFMLVGAISFGWIAAMPLTAAVCPLFGLLSCSEGLLPSYTCGGFIEVRDASLRDASDEGI